MRLSIVGSQVWLFCSEFLGWCSAGFSGRLLVLFSDFYFVLLILATMFMVVALILLGCLFLYCCVCAFVEFTFKWVGYFGFVNLLLGLGINVVLSSRMLDKCSELRFEKD